MCVIQHVFDQSLYAFEIVTWHKSEKKVVKGLSLGTSDVDSYPVSRENWLPAGWMHEWKRARRWIHEFLSAGRSEVECRRICEESVLRESIDFVRRIDDFREATKTYLCPYNELGNGDPLSEQDKGRTYPAPPTVHDLDFLYDSKSHSKMRMSRKPIG
ncbi:nwd2 [Moniliophthora roreri]|nr:nwd2 [Moniliophthora roreri]